MPRDRYVYAYNTISELAASTGSSHNSAFHQLCDSVLPVPDLAEYVRRVQSRFQGRKPSRGCWRWSTAQAGMGAGNLLVAAGRGFGG